MNQKSVTARLAAAESIELTILAPISRNTAWACIFNLGSDWGGTFEASDSLEGYELADDVSEKVEAQLPELLGVDEDVISVSYTYCWPYVTYPRSGVAEIRIDGEEVDEETEHHINALIESIGLNSFDELTVEAEVEYATADGTCTVVGFPDVRNLDLLFYLLNGRERRRHLEALESITVEKAEAWHRQMSSGGTWLPRLDPDDGKAVQQTLGQAHASAFGTDGKALPFGQTHIVWVAQSARRAIAECNQNVIEPPGDWLRHLDAQTSVEALVDQEK